MTTDLNDRIADFHVRLGRVEEELINKQATDRPAEDVIEIISATVALVSCFMGFGLPNHYYQYVFGTLIIGALYHSHTFPHPKKWYDWSLVPLNILVLAMLLKLVIGGGEAKPFDWISYPTIEGGLTSFTVTWQQTNIAKWTLPLTVIQTFFLVLTLFGMLIGFELFCGLTSFVLVVLSLPALVSFEWEWALPGMIAALFTFYLQKD